MIDEYAGAPTADKVPAAHHIIMVDFDGTIIPWGPLMERRDPYPGVAAAMQALLVHGYRIGIFTSRMSRSWAIHTVGEAEADAFLAQQYEYVRGVLETHDIPFSFITAEKVPAEAYFDDRAIGVPPGTLAGALVHFAREAT